MRRARGTVPVPARHRDTTFRARSVTRSGREGDRVPGRRCRDTRRCGGCLMCAPIGGRSGPVGAHPRNTGHCSNAGGLSAVGRSPLYVIRRRRVIGAARGWAWRILNRLCFPEPAAILAFNPHQRISLEDRERRYLRYQSGVAPASPIPLHGTRVVSDMPIVVDRHRREDPRCR